MEKSEFLQWYDEHCEIKGYDAKHSESSFNFNNLPKNVQQYWIERFNEQYYE